MTKTSPQTHHDPYLTCNTTTPPHQHNNDKRKPCSPRIHTPQTDFLGELEQRAKLLLLSLIMIMELQMRIEQVQVMTFWSSSPSDCPPRLVNQRQTHINSWLILEGSQRYKRRDIYKPCIVFVM